MSSPKSEKNPLVSKTVLTWAAVALGVVIILCGLSAFALVGYARLYEGRVFPGVRVLGVRLDGLTEQEARSALEKAVDESLNNGLRFRYTPPENAPTREITLQATTVAESDPDASRELIRYDLAPAAAAAWSYGRNGSLLTNTFAQWRARVHPVTLDAAISMDEAQIRSGIEDSVEGLFPPVEDARLDIQVGADGTPTVTVVPEKAGRALDIDPALRTLRVQAERLAFSPIPLEDHAMLPSINAAHAEAVKGQVPGMLAHAPFTLTHDGETKEVTKALFAEWLGITLHNNEPRLTIPVDRFTSGVRTLFPTLEKTAKEGSLTIEDGKIITFEAGTEGVALDAAATLAPLLAMTAEAASPEARSFPIVVIRTEPVLTGQDPERLGIREIIGIGRSDFSGSPTNRRKNIAIGVSRVNGTLIPPGGEFSMLQTLGEFTAEAGWLPELVIKGNKTVPELGGGLCQIGTTAFRGALASGLPITQRRNHSYRVRYYEPAGTDATIYDPAPDFRFMNDTPNHILIHAYTVGDEVIYEFWGTEDGRSAKYKGVEEVTDVAKLKPRIYNVSSPPPTKLIETLDLPPGQKKCTESAHAGADAEFTYAVTYADGTVKENSFTSHYRPWQAVCLIGVESLSEPVAETPAEEEAAPLTL
ncbi:MAG: hypothetical protein RL141_415 [Candidatus Parcubacteria bacterium]|jgi:vancomycin resistance protein YoaR